MKLKDETGTTLVELMVSLVAGMAIITALTVALLTTMHASARVSARVDATQRARIAMTRLMEELHSACIAPEIAPVKKESTGTKMIFVHQRGSAVSPTPIKSVVTYANGKLTQTDYAWKTGSSPNWTFEENSPAAVTTLLTGVAPIPPSPSIFSYYRYASGTISPTAQSTPLTSTESELTVQVTVGIAAKPTASPVQDANSEANVTDSATLRLTPPSFNEGSPSEPCQ